MSAKKKHGSHAGELRRRASDFSPVEELRAPENQAILTPESARRMLNELQVHKTQLEVLNQDLLRNQAALEKSQARYFDFYNLAPVGYLTFTSKAAITDANLTIAAMLGVTKQFLVGKPLGRFIHSEDQSGFHLHLKQCFAAGVSKTCELRLMKKGSGAFWVLMEATLAPDDAGETLCHAVLSDITERKLAEEALRASQDRYRALMEQSAEALALVEIETNEVVEINPRFTEMLGYSLPEDSPLQAKNYTVDSEANMNAKFDCLLKQRFLPTETRIFRHKDGNEIPVERSARLIKIDGRDFLLVSLRDMTKENRRQAELARDFELACRVQRGLLPKLADSPHVRLRSLYHPSRYISGDSYVLEWCNGGELLCGFLFDISGHDLATALQTASVNVFLREALTKEIPMLSQMQQVNSRLNKYFTEGTFAAILGFELDLSLQELRYVGAGITQFYANGNKIATPGMFAGLWEDAEFIAGTMPVKPGDCLHFLTDGYADWLVQYANDAFWSPDGKDFDADVAALDRLGASGMLRDDATAVCLKINGLPRQDIQQ